jgi:hypothetical protein
MTDISSNTRSAMNIIQAQRAEKRVGFKEKKERLANSSQPPAPGRERQPCRDEVQMLVQRRNEEWPRLDSCMGEHEKVVVGL